MITQKMNWFSVLVYHFVLVDIALALALAGNKVETTKESQVTAGAASVKTTVATSAPPTAATEAPVKATASEGEERKKAEASQAEKETVEKSLPKKRGVLQDLYYKRPTGFDENEFDPNEDVAPEEFFTAPQREADGPYFRSNPDGESAFANDDGYFENDGRSKRTAILDGLYNSPQEYSKPEIELSPEEVMMLLRLLEERRLYNSPAQGRWSDYDNSVDSIEADMRDEDEYKEGSRFGDAYDRNYDGYARYPSGMKRFMVTKRKRSDYLGNPKLRVPVFRRAIL